MPNFETFTKRMAPLVKQPFVTVQKRGIISMNAAAHALLGEPEALELLYDPKERIVGFRAVSRESEHAYPLRAQNGKSVGPYIVSGTAFVKYYNIDVAVSRRWVAYLDDGILCIDLKDAGTEVTSNRSAGKESGVDDEDA
ncbi:hypothetical protein AB0D67_24935 [Streptosporangium sp. NPDC048047]|uniref:hypothetical protein n=1 Tax=Streptosporangium sp. NPDC048047 TaxID=3155748 RepID=UPI003422DF0C